jgi:large subunit ribosomal protein L19e
MNFRSQKNLASRALGISKKRIKLNVTTENKKDFKELISREGVKDLVEQKAISVLPKTGNSRTRANKIMTQKAKGRRSGHGNRKGTANARFNTKTKWIIKIRSLRVMLKNLKEDGRLDVKTHRELYRKSKGNFFRNKRHISLYMEQNNLIKEPVKQVKTKEGDNK